MCSNSHFHTGIEFEQLVSELRLGVRLPSPPFCPFEVAEIMKKCFHENPHQRPTFEEMRTSLTQIISVLRRPPTQAFENDNIESDMSVLYSDLAMKEQYMFMRRQHETLNSILHSIEEGEVYPTAQAMPFQKSIEDSIDIMDCNTQKEHLSYASLLNTTELALDSGTNMNENTYQKSLELIRNTRKGHIKHGNRSTKYKTLPFEHISKNTLGRRPSLSSVTFNPIYNLNSYSKDGHKSSDFGLVPIGTTVHPRSHQTAMFRQQ